MTSKTTNKFSPEVRSEHDWIQKTDADSAASGDVPTDLAESLKTSRGELRASSTGARSSDYRARESP
ncbi:hypothetical protein ACVWYQ_003306 [Bradyrhizobium sp. USDA 3397]